MSNGALTGLRLEAQWLPPAAAWAEGLQVKLPKPVLDNLVSGRLAAGDQEARSLAREAAGMLRSRAAFLRAPTAASRLPVSYRMVPSGARQVLARITGRIQRHRQSIWADFPGFPLDLSADLAADLGAAEPRPMQKTRVVLSHDIDSPEGLRNLVSKFLPIEEEFGARSSNYVVPCDWPVAGHDIIG